jgi:uncharacterized damage-inducible protein DinB
MIVSEIARIQDQLQRAFDGNAWHGPALSALLADVTAGQAAARPIAGAHSIWELVLHIIAWERVVVRRLSRETVVDLPEAENFPTVRDARETAWEKTRRELARAHQELKGKIGTLEESGLDATVAGQRYSVYVMLHGVIQHNLYHAGQIAILKKYSP